MVAQVADYGHSVTLPVVFERGACLEPWALSQLSWSKHCFLSKKLLTVLFAPPLNREPKHGGYSLLSISTSSLLFPHDSNAACFLLFSDKELNELTVSLSA